MLSVLDDLVLGLRTGAWRVRRAAKRLWKTSTAGELFAVFWLFLCAVFGLLSAVFATDSWTAFLIPAIAMWAYLDLLNQATYERLTLWQLAREKPAGAPMAVVVECAETGHEHRLAYTNGQWQEIK
jgi:hypothetical protein